MSDRKIFTIINTYAIHHSHDSLNSNKFSIVAEEEDDRPPEYLFFSEYLTPLNNENEIWAKGLFLLNLYNGAVNIHLNNYDWNSEVKFTKAFNWVTEKDITPKNKESINPLSPYSNNRKINTRGKTEMKKKHFITYSIYLNKTELDVRCLLLLAGSTINWISLYSIYDTLNYYSNNFNQLIIDSGYTQKEIKAFTGTANSYGLLGINSRHGQKGWKTPSKTMTLLEAKEMILGITKKYINDK